MAFTRRETDKDATWARAWTADTHDDLADISAIIGTAGPHHGDVAYVTSENDYFWWQDNGTWLHLAEGSGGLFGVGQWIFNNNTITAPTGNQIRFNAGYPYTAVTGLKLTSLTDEGVDTHAILVALPIGTTILVQDKNDSTQSAKFISNGVSIDNTTWVQIPVAHLAHGNSLSNNQAAIVRATGPGTGNVTGPASSVDDNIALFDGVTGQLLKDSGRDIADVATLPIDLTTDVTGVLPTASGGTSVNIASAALPLGSGQVAFPATANPSGNANTLDDYEEGTWTPNDASGAGLTFTTPSGNYVKIGKFVQFTAFLVYPATADVSNAKIGGLPFTVQAGVPGGSAKDAYPSVAGVPLYLYVRESATNIELFLQNGAAQTNVGMTGATMFISGTYISAS